jgi:predicted enzyme related to lactoylglutathione lyase
LASHDATKTVGFLKEEAGGFIVDPPLDLPSRSRICLFNEPSGVTLAMIQPAVRR